MSLPRQHNLMRPVPLLSGPAPTVNPSGTTSCTASSSPPAPGVAKATARACRAREAPSGAGRFPTR
jgi:hypothetical protein